MQNHISLFVSVPIASFRVAQAREYWETYPCPPPSTVYGLLLSLVGETNRLAHQGTQLAVALLLPEPPISTVLRKLWRIKSAQEDPGRGTNARPDFQELLTDVRLAVFLKKGEQEQAKTSLYQRVVDAFANPSQVERFGGLCLGESTHLVDEIRELRPADASQGALWLRPAHIGTFSLPIWPDHVGSLKTHWAQFSLEEAPEEAPLDPTDAWVTILPKPQNH